jgi:hypothetical protein
MTEQHPGRHSSSADAAATRWGDKHPDEDVEHDSAPFVPDDQDIVPNHHSASAEAASLRWREQHEDDA